MGSLAELSYFVDIRVNRKWTQRHPVIVFRVCLAAGEQEQSQKKLKYHTLRFFWELVWTCVKIQYYSKKILRKKTQTTTTPPTQMNSANDLLGAHSLGDPGPATVHQTHDVAALSTGLAHDGHLGS